MTTDSRRRSGRHVMTRQPENKVKTDRLEQSCPFGYGKKHSINELELSAVVWKFEQFRLYVYKKPRKLLIDHQTLEPLINGKRSSKTYSAQLKRWLAQLAHFKINVSHQAGKRSALTNYFSSHPCAPLQADDAYDKEFVTKYGCRSQQPFQTITWRNSDRNAIKNKQ